MVRQDKHLKTHFAKTVCVKKRKELIWRDELFCFCSFQHADGEATKIALQHWYHEDAGRELCAELGELL